METTIKTNFVKGINAMRIDILPADKLKIALKDIAQISNLMLAGDTKDKMDALKSIKTVNALAGYILFHCKKDAKI